jgi:hypothetical protein
MPSTRGKRRLFYEFFKQFGRVLQVGIHQRDRVARGGISRAFNCYRVSGSL